MVIQYFKISSGVICTFRPWKFLLRSSPSHDTLKLRCSGQTPNVGGGGGVLALCAPHSSIALPERKNVCRRCTMGNLGQRRPGPKGTDTKVKHGPPSRRSALYSLFNINFPSMQDLPHLETSTQHPHANRGLFFLKFKISRFPYTPSPCQQTTTMSISTAFPDHSRIRIEFSATEQSFKRRMCIRHSVLPNYPAIPRFTLLLYSILRTYYILTCL